jgi:putative Flp pilus-assembly TadE/G-like protein
MVAFCIVALLGLLGLAFDIGRMFITKNESMGYADAAAVAAARELDGTATGGQRATNAALQAWGRWNFSNTDFSAPVVEFSTTKDGPWEANPASWVNVGFARVTANVSNVKLYFLPVAGTAGNGQVAALAVAGQVPAIPKALFPFSPITHVDNAFTHASVTAIDPDYGFQLGKKYTLRWAQKPDEAVCPDDAGWQAKYTAGAGVSSWRGYITNHGAAVVYDEITSDLMDRAVQPIIDQAIFTGSGVKSTEGKGMEDRISQDTDHFTTEYFGNDSSSYLWRQQNGYAPYGNERRIVTVVVNTGFANQGGTLYAANQQLIAVGYAQFFLYALTYDPGGNATYCGEYIGNDPCEGCKGRTARPGDGSTTNVVRLVQ